MSSLLYVVYAHYGKENATMNQQPVEGLYCCSSDQRKVMGRVKQAGPPPPQTPTPPPFSQQPPALHSAEKNTDFFSSSFFLQFTLIENTHPVFSPSAWSARQCMHIYAHAQHATTRAVSVITLTLPQASTTL